jgi:alkylation response protein AidB-like acyl-CoA dehydrogenase
MTDAEQRAALLRAVDALTPSIDARAVESERAGTMPSDLVARAREAGLFRLNLPRSLGGLEADPLTTTEVIERLCRADGSAGWTIIIGNSTAFFAWLDPHVARRLLAETPDPISAAMFGPHGSAIRDGRSFVVDGRWPFVSGCPHADWLQLGVLTLDRDHPTMLPGGRPDWRFAFARADDVEVIGTWDAAGLRATGSHDVEARRLRVPDEQVPAPLFDPPCHDGPLWRVPFFTQVGIAFMGFPLGVGRRALDELVAVAATKTRPAATEPIAHDEHLQVELARADSALLAARAFAHDAIGDVWTTACTGDSPDLHQRARVMLAAHQAMAAATAAADTALRLVGASAVYSAHPLQRCVRDLHVAGTHVYFSADAARRCAKVRLGLEQPTFLL